MSSSPAIELASTIQSASINRAPSLRHDLNPSTAASRKEPVTIPDSERSSSSIPYSAIKPVPRRKTLPPLPDLRFEQSYLASLQGAESWARIAWITGRDQVCPFPSYFLPLPRCAAQHIRYATLFVPSAVAVATQELTATALHKGPPSPPPRHPLDTGAARLALLESVREVQRRKRWESYTALVVGRQ